VKTTLIFRALPFKAFWFNTQNGAKKQGNPAKCGNLPHAAAEQKQPGQQFLVYHRIFN
jgi:hypothetical protein